MDQSIFSETMANLTWKEIDREIRPGRGDCAAALRSPGEHGPTMPITVDVYFSLILTRRIQELLKQNNRKTVIAPPNYWGICNPTAAFPGTFTLRKRYAQGVVVRYSGRGDGVLSTFS